MDFGVGNADRSVESDSVGNGEDSTKSFIKVGSVFLGMNLM